MSQINVKLRTKFYDFYDEVRGEFETDNDCIKAFIIKEKEEGNQTFTISLYKKYLKTKSVIKTRNTAPQITLGENGREIFENENTRELKAKTEKPITSLKEALDYFEVDTKIWKVVSWNCKSWDTSMKIEKIKDGKIVHTPVKKTNYLVNVQLVKKENEIDYQKIYKIVNQFVKNDKINIVKTENFNAGVVALADIHAGLKIEKFTKHTQEYNVRKLTEYLTEIVTKTNQLGFKEVHVVILGDLVESVTGYNKIETLKEMEFGMTGGNLIIAAYELLHKMLSSINNLKHVYMVSGNHDRLTPEKPMDKDGGAAQIVAYMLSKTVPTTWHPFIINTEIDNICYILNHGDHKIAKQDLGKVVFEYGDQSKYNVFLTAHLHIRKSTKIFQEKNTILSDTNKYRAVTVAPIVTGNRWAEENGYSCSPGFSIFVANSSRNNVHHFDFALSR
ncbi:MAG: metallophosphoesterase [Planctomycetota bacterium]|jgi:UDP-2,3-diacylglucosamine pyrophosphatase LpxH